MKIRRLMIIFVIALFSFGCAQATLSPQTAEAASGKIRYYNVDDSAYSIKVYSGKKCTGSKKTVKHGKSAKGKSYRVKAYSYHSRVTSIVSSIDKEGDAGYNECVTITGYNGQYVLVEVYSNN